MSSNTRKILRIMNNPTLRLSEKLDLVERTCNNQCTA